MMKTKVGIIKEGKVPIDKRVPITPDQALEIQAKFPNVEVLVQRSDVRCFPDAAYEEKGLKMVDSMDMCDIIFGVKEVPMAQLIPGKTYFFFSHTIKKQEYNKPLLKALLEKKIKMVDYETLTDENGQRVIAFGRWAGIVGAYNAIWTYGKRYNLYHIRRAHECFDLEDLKTEFSKVKLPPIKMVVTGGGRVAKGAMEVLVGMNVRKVTPAALLTQSFDFPVFAQLNSRDYNTHNEGHEFNRGEFYSHAENFHSDFLKYAKVAEILIAAAFWEPKAPTLFKREDATKNDFCLHVIADITCDIEGSIPSTKKPSTIDDPVYDYDPTQDEIMPAFSEEGNISMMAVDNLPCELPRDASNDFGNMLVSNVLPHLFTNDEFRIIQDATITDDGKLTSRYQYLKEWVEGR
jgi:saccharopine dehydrogenase (NAD+, L-lysine forming)